jgi:2-polyprenyl-3-methyl-5-hydroxy-6-metoxy-1,4-benzoquinol methylase
MGRFVSITAIDLVPHTSFAADNVTWVQHDLNLEVPGFAAQFDVIVAAEIIEHLENPRLTMREIYRMLRPNGTAIVTTPNNESWRSLIALLLRRHFVAFGETSYPAHITALLPMDLQRIAKEAGFTSTRCEFTNHGGIPGWPSASWQKLSLGLARGCRFSDNVALVAHKRG